jgi:hypothetical protein
VHYLKCLCGFRGVVVVEAESGSIRTPRCCPSCGSHVFGLVDLERIEPPISIFALYEMLCGLELHIASSYACFSEGDQDKYEIAEQRKRGMQFRIMELIEPMTHWQTDPRWFSRI